MCTVFVAHDADVVKGFYALAAGGVENWQAPNRVTKGVSRHPIPVVILARLAVHEDEQGAGLGRAMLRDALLRVAQSADTIGVRALLLHAKDDTARDFYMHIAEFESSPTDPLHLFLLMKDLRKSLPKA